MDIEDKILDILDEKLSKNKKLSNIENQIINTKGDLKILLGGTYKNTSYNNQLFLNISSKNIVLKEIVADNGGELLLLLLIKIAIENNLTITGKAEPFIHSKMYSPEKWEKRRKILRQYYESFFFKSIGKSEI